MKKLIAVLIALAMVLSMSVVAFAEFDGIRSPADIAEDAETFNGAVNNPLLYVGTYAEIMDQGIYTREDHSLMHWDEAWEAYYAYVLANATNDPLTAVTEIVSIVAGGYLDAGTAITMAGEALMGGIGGDGEEGDMSGIIDGILSGILGGETEPEVSAEEYVDELAALLNEGASFDEIASKIGDDLASSRIVVSQLPEIAQLLTDRIELGEIEDNETVQQILAFIEGLGGEGDGGFQFPDFGDFTLPWDNDNSSSGSFLDTILGILGTIGDLLFGGGDGEGGDNPWEEPWENPWEEPNEPGETPVIPNTGDVSFIAVAAVAAVAGAALILTRKKSDDAE